MDLTLHVADADGLINLDGICPPGTHYTAARNDNTGVVRLTPVRVVAAVPAARPATQGQATTDVDQGDPADVPWPA